MNWTPRAVLRFRELRAAGKTNQEIAATLSREFGIECSLVAVKSKARDLGMSRGTIYEKWTEEKRQRLRDLFWDHSCTYIAAILTAEYGVPVTRNAVIGQTHRMGLATPLARAKNVRRPREHVPKPYPVNVAPVPQPIEIDPLTRDGNRVTMLTLEANDCRWPHGHPGERNFHFCAQRKEPTSSYCAPHERLAWAGKGRASAQDRAQAKRASISAGGKFMHGAEPW